MNYSRQWFLCTVKMEKQVEGKEILQKVAEKYLFDAMTYTEAEARCISEMKAFSEMFEVADIVKKKYSTVILDDSGTAEKFFEVKTSLITFDDKTMTEKRTKDKLLVQASSFDEAYKVFIDESKGWLGDFELNAIVEVPIVDVYVYKEQEQKAE